MKIKNKLGQHEIVGFVVIIVIVSIIGLIFLSFSIGRGDVAEKTSVEISDFLQSSMYYTTECASGYIPNYENLQDLIKACYRNEKCFDDKMACDVLNKTFDELIDKSFLIGVGGKYKAYKLNVYYTDENEGQANKEILKIDKGDFMNCSSKTGASQEIFMDPGNINVEMKMCYK